MTYVDGDNTPGSDDGELLGLKWTDNHWTLVKGKTNVTGNDSTSHDCKLTLLKPATEGGDIKIPNLLYDTGLCEVGPHTEDYKNQWFWAYGGTTLVYPRHGGCWVNGDNGGSFDTAISDDRSVPRQDLGFISYRFK